MSWWSANSSWTGFLSPSRASEQADSGTLRHFPQMSRDEAPAPKVEAQQDAPGVVSTYTRGSITPSESPERSLPEFQRAVANDNKAPETPEQTVSTGRPPAPRLEMKGPIAQHAVMMAHAGSNRERNEARRAEALKGEAVKTAAAVGQRLSAVRANNRIDLPETFRNGIKR